MAEKDTPLMKALREYRESLERMTPEERAKEEEKRKAIEKMLFLDRTVNPEN